MSAKMVDGEVSRPTIAREVRTFKLLVSLGVRISLSALL
jgi:hypothetical protein